MDNARTRQKLREMDEELAMKDPLEIFEDFYEEIQGTRLKEEEVEMMRQIFEQAKEE